VCSLSDCPSGGSTKSGSSIESLWRLEHVESLEKGDWNTEIEGMQSMAVVITDAYHLKNMRVAKFGESGVTTDPAHGIARKTGG
jgi:hypothetical protein